MTVTTNHVTTENSPGKRYGNDYPNGDGKPVAETYAHLYAILMTLEVLRQYLSGQRAVVLGNQFLYYEEGQSGKRIAPDVFVCFEVEPDGRDNYKVWEEGSVPAVAFEMTSPSTRDEDEGLKKTLYAQIGIEEYWQFDPKGEWITEKLRGYRLVDGVYRSISDNISLALGLRLEVDDTPQELPMRNYRLRSRNRRRAEPPRRSSMALISFYRLDTGEKLLRPEELKIVAIAAQQEASQSRAETLVAQQEAEVLKATSEKLAAELAEYKARFGSLDC
jgi:Uma2 family endonuclease